MVEQFLQCPFRGVNIHNVILRRVFMLCEAFWDNHPFLEWVVHRGSRPQIRGSEHFASAGGCLYNRCITEALSSLLVPCTVQSFCAVIQHDYLPPRSFTRPLLVSYIRYYLPKRWYTGEAATDGRFGRLRKASWAFTIGVIVKWMFGRLPLNYLANPKGIELVWHRFCGLYCLQDKGKH